MTMRDTHLIAVLPSDHLGAAAIVVMARPAGRPATVIHLDIQPLAEKHRLVLAAVDKLDIQIEVSDPFSHPFVIADVSQPLHGEVLYRAIERRQPNGRRPFFRGEVQPARISEKDACLQNVRGVHWIPGLACRVALSRAVFDGTVRIAAGLPHGDELASAIKRFSLIPDAAAENAEPGDFLALGAGALAHLNHRFNSQSPGGLVDLVYA